MCQNQLKGQFGKMFGAPILRDEVWWEQWESLSMMGRPFPFMRKHSMFWPLHIWQPTTTRMVIGYTWPWNLVLYSNVDPHVWWFSPHVWWSTNKWYKLPNTFMANVFSCLFIVQLPYYPECLIISWVRLVMWDTWSMMVDLRHGSRTAAKRLGAGGPSPGGGPST